MSWFRRSAASLALGVVAIAAGACSEDAAGGPWVGIGSSAGGMTTTTTAIGGNAGSGTAGSAVTTAGMSAAGSSVAVGGSSGSAPLATSGSAGVAAGGAGGAGGAAGVAGMGGSAGGGSLIPAGYTGMPWQGAAQKIPGKIEFELYDVGVEGVAFHDTTPINDGNGAFNLNIDTEIAKFRRDEPVDISFTKTCCDRDDGVQSELDKSYVGWTATGEWIVYTVEVAEAGTYVATGRFGVEKDMTLSFTINGKKLGPFALKGTGSPHNWTFSEDMFEVDLPAGKQLFRVDIETVGLVNMDWIEFSKKP